VAFRRGFKTEAEQITQEVRADLGLSLRDRLDPLRLADELDIPVWPLSILPTAIPQLEGIADAVTYLSLTDRAALSAVTVFSGTARVIVHNDAHAPARRASNLTHELAHALLFHPPSPARDRRGCRQWHGDVEDVAHWRGGALLIPSPAAWWAASRRLSLDRIATHFGCSLEMARWRLNVTGARRLLTG
jgi:Zn-dependent peptidase ImmA (M78 family)